MKNFFLLLFILLIPINASAATEFGTFEDAKSSIKEVMKAYYIRGDRLQYNYSRAGYGSYSPEEATTQDMNYLVCASFTYSAYVEAFGVGSSDFPRYNYEINTAGANYYNTNKNNTAKLDGNFLLFYDKSATSDVEYVYNNAVNFNDFVNLIQPGDLFVYTGHALIAYDVVINPNTGNKDVLILNSTQSPYITTNHFSTGNISYNIFPSSKAGVNSILNVDKEGTIQAVFLSSLSKFVSSNKMKCGANECSIIRPYYNKSGKAVFNYNINQTKTKNTKLRTQFPGLLIEKSVDKGDNSTVYWGDELTYTIKITNRSNVEGAGTPYNTKFYIEETIGELVTYVSSDGQKNGDKIKWAINSLGIGETKTLTYKVKVKKKYSTKASDKKIVASGKFYVDESASITTGTVVNKIIPKLSINANSYKSCYQNIGNIAGLEMLDKVYECMYSDIDFNFSDFKFDDLFNKNTSNNAEDSKAMAELITLNNISYTNMILNNYWSGLIKTTDNKYVFPFWKGTSASTRAKNINYKYFKDGDILLYSEYDESNDVYAYIYIDGKFVRKNIGSQTSRPEYTFNYYSSDYTKLYGGYSNVPVADRNDVLEFANYQMLFNKEYYVILRPELIIKEKDSIEVDTSTLMKTTYNQNDKSLVITGAKLNIYYNDGSKESKDLEDSAIKITGFDSSKIGTNIVTVEYAGLSTTLSVNIVEPESSEKTILDEEKTIPDEEKNPQTGTYVSCALLIICFILNFIRWIYKNKYKLFIK